MKEVEHTDGHWWYKLWDWGAEIISADGLIAELINDEPPRGKLEMEANAKIIAAAPEMLEALENVLKWFDLECTHSEQQIEAIKTAIKNAKG